MFLGPPSGRARHPDLDGLARWNLASIRCLLTNPAYRGLVYGNRWHRRGSLERRSATAPRPRSSLRRIDTPREEWILVAQIPPLVSPEQFERVQARLVTNRRFAQRNNKAHPYLLRNLVSCGVCGLSCFAKTTMQGYRYYFCTGKMTALFSHREEKCPSRFSPCEGLDQLVWADLCALLTEPEQVTQALARAHGGAWLPQELQARQGNLRRGQASLAQQLERLTEAYLAGIVLLDEYRRRRSERERRTHVLEEQQRQLTAQVDRREELAVLSHSMEDFCQRIRPGLEQATFEQKRKLVELLIDRVLVTDGEVEIRYVMPTSKSSENTRLCHLYLDYRTRSPGREKAYAAGQRVQSLCQCPTNAGRDRDDAHDSQGTSEKGGQERRGGRSQVCGEALRPRRLVLPR